MIEDKRNKLRMTDMSMFCFYLLMNNQMSTRGNVREQKLWYNNFLQFDRPYFIFKRRGFQMSNHLQEDKFFVLIFCLFKQNTFLEFKIPHCCSSVLADMFCCYSTCKYIPLRVNILGAHLQCK